MSNILRPARGADDERLFPAGYIESVSSIHTVTLTDNLIPISDTTVTGISVINDIILTDGFPIMYDQSDGIVIRGIRLVDSLVSLNDILYKDVDHTFTDMMLIADRFPPVVGAIRQVKLTDELINLDDVILPSILFTKILTDSLPIITDGFNTDTTAIYAVKLEDGLYIFIDDLKSSILRVVKLEDQFIELNDTIDKFIIRGIVLTDYLHVYDNATKQLKLTFKEDMPLWMSDASTQRFHWVCVYAVSKIENNIGVIENIEEFYLVDRIEETAGGDVIENIDMTFNIGEINQLEDD